MSALILVLAATVLGGDSQIPVYAYHADEKHEINVWVARDVAPGPKVQLNINTRNVSRLHIEAFPTDGIEYLKRRDGQKKTVPSAIGPAAKQWDVSVEQKGQRNSPRDNYFSRQVNLPFLKPGVYRLEFSGAGVHQATVVNVTNLAVVLKRSPYRALAWVTDFKTGAVVSNAEILSFDKAGHQLSTVRTQSDGTAVFPLSFKYSNQRTVVRRGDDLAGLQTDSGDPNGKLRAHFQTDRPIYRPGQTVFYKAILRRTAGQGYKAVTSGDIKITFRDPKDNPIEEIHVKPNAMGSIGGSFNIPQEGMTGPYTLVLKSGDDEAYQTFTVAAYRKPEFKVEATPVAKRYLAGEHVKFVVQASYYFGAPVPQAQVQWVVRRSPTPFFMPNADDRYFYSGDGNLYSKDTYQGEPVVGTDTTVTDNTGKAVIEVKSDPRDGDVTYSLEAVVTDGSRRQVTGSSAVSVYSAQKRVGLSSPQSVTALGRLIPIDLRVVNLDGNPVGGKVTLKLIEHYWDEKAEANRVRQLADRVVDVPSTGRASTTLPAKSEGDLEVQATLPDGTGRTAKASMDAYVAGLGYKPGAEDKSPTAELKLDRRIYKPGETANAYFQTNRPKRPSLLVVEGRDIFKYKVLDNGKSGRAWSFPTSLELSPNAHVSFAMWAEGGLQSGSVILPVPDPSRAIKVETIPNSKEIRPGDPVKLGIRTTDYKGRPISAEIALSVVDEAIYALSPDTTADPYGFYWGLRESNVSTVSSAPSEVSGGAYQRSSAVVPVRQRFEDTAYWNGFVATGANGEGTAEFEAPGNLTTWRITARGVTGDTQVGMAKEQILATRPVTFRLATPRQVVQGDEFTLIGTANNRTGQPVSVDVSLNPTGIEVTGANQTVTVPPHGEKKVLFKLHAVSVPASGTFTLLARMNGPTADLSDALQVSVPVVPKGVRETTISTGTLDTAAVARLDQKGDGIPDASYMTIRVFAGVIPSLNQSVSRVLLAGRYGSPSAADGLLAVSAVGLAGHENDVKESMALLSRTQQADGWGWWDHSRSEPVITARVGMALAAARGSGIRVFDSMWDAAKNSARQNYDRTNLWEFRAQLAAAMLELGEPNAGASVQEVRERGISVSPYSRLRLAEVLVRSDRGAAKAILGKVLPLVADGAGTAFLPVGDGIGWSASETETTAQLLRVLVQLSEEEGLQRRLANRLAVNETGYRSLDEDAAVARALSVYAKAHPQAREVGKVTAIIDGKRVDLKPSTVDPSSTYEATGIRVPVGSIRFERKGMGEAFYTVSLRYYRNFLNENATGVRVMRRYEVQNEAKIWVEVNRAIRPNEPVRCTVVVWGDDRPDAIRVTEPIPTGFEFLDGEAVDNGEQDVRDGAVVHYLRNGGAPVFFRYYLRAETDGKMTILPATAEYLRRPVQHGQTATLPVVVHP